MLLFFDDVLALQAYAARLHVPAVFGGTREAERQRIFNAFRRSATVNAVAVSKVCRERSGKRGDRYGYTQEVELWGGHARWHVTRHISKHPVSLKCMVVCFFFFCLRKVEYIII